MTRSSRKNISRHIADIKAPTKKIAEESQKIKIDSGKEMQKVTLHPPKNPAILDVNKNTSINQQHQQEVLKTAKHPFLARQEQLDDRHVVHVHESEKNSHFWHKNGLTSSLKTKTIAGFIVVFLCIALSLVVIGFLRNAPINELAQKQKQDLAKLFSDNLFVTAKNRVTGALQEGLNVSKNAISAGLLGVDIAKETKEFTDKFPEYFFNNQGASVIEHLERLAGLFEKFNAANMFAGKKEENATGESFDLSFLMKQYSSALTQTIAWLKNESPHHIVIFLQNPAEIRPTGGFIGSFIDVVIDKGGLASFEVHDVSDVDSTLSTKTIPPKPLQALVGNWRVADANWFFNFPDSAQLLINLMEQSDLYRKNNTTFDGAIAISGDVVSDLLKQTGPLIMKNGVEINAENVFEVIQSNVQEGQKNKTENPKKILGELTGLMVEKMRANQLGEEGDMLRLATHWLREKDIMIYLKDKKLQEFLENNNVAGTTTKIPSTFNGTYVAVVQANIGGQKSDYYINQKVSLRASIDTSGLIQNHLEITRIHKAPTTAEWWYKAPNIVYTEVYTPNPTTPYRASGLVHRSIMPKINYEKSNFSSNPKIKNLESTQQIYSNIPDLMSFVDNDKNIFAGWITTQPRTESVFSMDYSHPLRSVGDGVEYQFIIDKQSGVKSSYHVEVNSPIGYVWKENNRPIFDLDLPEIQSTEVIKLTLKKTAQ